MFGCFLGRVSGFHQVPEGVEKEKCTRNLCTGLWASCNFFFPDTLTLNWNFYIFNMPDGSELRARAVDYYSAIPRDFQGFQLFGKVWSITLSSDTLHHYALFCYPHKTRVAKVWHFLLYYFISRVCCHPLNYKLFENSILDFLLVVICHIPKTDL